MSLMKSIYQSFINIGWSPNQARIMTAEVGRENDFNPQFVFGRHTDASNGKVNLGMISWQGSRGTALDKRLKSKGLIQNGRIVRSQAALNEMASFMAHEIKTNPAYSATKKAFLNNPNVSYDVGKKVLGNNFIRWDYSGKAVLGNNVGKHHAKRDGYYRKLGGQGGTNYTPQQGGGQQQQAPDPRLSMSAPDLLANLRKANGKRTGVELLHELSTNNGQAGREIGYLRRTGATLDQIASQLGIKLPTQAATAPSSSANEYDDVMSSLLIDEPQQAITAQSQPQQPVSEYDDVMSSLMSDDAPQPQQAAQPMQTTGQIKSNVTAKEPIQQQMPAASEYDDVMSSLTIEG